MPRLPGKLVAKRRLKKKSARRKMRKNFRLLKHMVEEMVREERLPCGFQLDDLPHLKPYAYSVNSMRKWSTDRSLVLWPYRGEPTLLVGCGGCHQQTNCGGYFHASRQEAVKYHREHDHRDCYTIDPTLGKNPHYLGGVENLAMPHVPDNSFDRIVFEGIRVPLSTPFYEEVYRVMKDGADCLLCDGQLLFEKRDGHIVFPNGSEYHTMYGFPAFFGFVEDGIYRCDADCPRCEKECHDKC